MNNLELRMYGLINYQLTGIQKGIQFGHAVVEYANKYFNTDLYQKWAKEWKTFIILNGGTTNKRLNDVGVPFGTLNNHLVDLSYRGIKVASFEEPDLGDQLTAVVFIVDQRVFDRKKYPNFDDYIIKHYGYDKKYVDYYDWISSDSIEKRNIANEWTEMMGGNENVFLRDFIFKFNLA